MSHTTGLIPKVYPLLVECVERGVAHGMRRVIEDCSVMDSVDLDGSEAQASIVDEVLDAICESFEIAQDGEDELA